MMPACPRDNDYSTLPPPGFSETNVVVKRGQLVELLRQILEKCQEDPSFLLQQPKQIDLLVSAAQLSLLSTPISPDDRRDFLNNIVSVGQDLLSDENSPERESTNESTLSSLPTTTTTTNLPIEIKKPGADDDFSLDDLANEYLLNEPTPPSSNEKTSPPSQTITILPISTITTDTDGDFSLDDLANEYLQNEPTPSSSNDKPTTPSESEEPALAFDNLSSSAPVTNILSSLVFSPPSSEPILITPPLESILFSNRLSSSDAADDADCIWKGESSALGQMFCKKTEEIPIIAVKRVSSCLLDRSLYDRLTRLIALLPKQCVRNSVQQQISIRPNEQFHRPQRGPNENRRPPPSNRPSFQQNSAQIHNRQPASLNSRQYSNSHYSNQQGNMNGYFIDRRPQQQQQQQQQQQYQQQAYQNRYSGPSYGSYPGEQQYLPKGGPPKTNTYNHNNQQQKKKPPNNNQYSSNQYPPQPRGPKKGGGGGGNKPNHDKSGANVDSK